MPSAHAATRAAPTTIAVGALDSIVPPCDVAPAAMAATTTTGAFSPKRIVRQARAIARGFAR